MSVSVLGMSSSIAFADDASDGLPCNSLCERWMRLGRDDAQPAPPAAPRSDTSAAVEQVAVPQQIPPPTNLVPQSGQPIVTALSDRKDQPRPHGVSAETKPVQRPVPLPPRRVRTVEAVVAVAAPVPPPRTLLTLEAPQAPFGSLQAPDRVAQVVAALPAPPAVPQVDRVDVAAFGALREPQPASEPLPPAADGSGAMATAPAPVTTVPPVAPAESIRVASVAGESEPAAPVSPAPPVRRSDAGWPPPIDVIGAVLAGGGVLKASP